MYTMKYLIVSCRPFIFSTDICQKRSLDLPPNANDKRIYWKEGQHLSFLPMQIYYASILLFVRFIEWAAFASI